MATSSRASRSVRSSVRCRPWALDAWWQELGSPRPFVVVDAGAGGGTLARSVLAAAPVRGCVALRARRALFSAACRTRPRAPARAPVHAFAAGRDPDEDEQPSRPVPDGPIVVSLGSLPPPGAHVVLVNELLDNLPVGCSSGRRKDGRKSASGRTSRCSAAGRAAACAGPHRGLPGIPRRLARRRGAGWLREALSSRRGRRVRLHDHDRGDGSSAPDRVVAHLSRPRSGRFAVPRPRGARHHVRGRARSARRGASAIRGA